MGEIETAVEQLTAAISDLRRRGASDPEIVQGHDRSVEPGLRRGLDVQNAIVEESGSHIRLFQADEDGTDEAVSDDGRLLPPSGQGISARIRADFVVTVPGRLLAVYSRCRLPDPERSVQRADRQEVAIGGFLHRQPARPLSGMNLTELGLAKLAPAS